MITVDGSAGEGGGQVLRSSLALSLLTGKPFRIHGIRAGRKKPGLLRQHLTSVRAAIEVGQAKARGATIGSRELTFQPGDVRAGSYRFAVGTAGSATLVLQTVLPALLVAPGESQLQLEGGTHNPWAPPYPFLERVFLPLVNRMGPRVRSRLERPGFYPAGGGLFHVSIEPADRLSPLDLLERGEVLRRQATSVVANLPPTIADRELGVIGKLLSWPKEALRADIDTRSRGPGNAILLEIESEHITELFTGFGQRRVPAEAVAEAAAKEAREYLAADVPVGKHLADQLLVPMAMAGGGTFRTLRPSRHTTTNIDIIRQFIDASIAVDKDAAGACRVTLNVPWPWRT